MIFEIAICDDCEMDRNYLKIQIERIAKELTDVRIHEFESGICLLEAMKDIAFSAVFLDIQMAGMDGNETAKEIREMDKTVVLGFYTGFAEPSPVSFEVQPYRYIMKNMAEEQKQNYIRDILNQMLCIAKMPVLTARAARQQLRIRAEHIIYIEKYKKGMRAHLSRRAFPVYGIAENEEKPDIRINGKLKDLYEELEQHGFGWPHDSYIINFNYVYSCTSKVLKLMEVEDIFQITRSKAKEFNKKKDRYLCSKYVKGERAL